MTDPRHIPIALPALGAYNVPFYDESRSVLDVLGDAEIERLNRVDHLGLSATVFAGANHSRLEYALLQCAVFHLLPKFHPGDQQLALGAKVHLSGVKTPVKSGEELLKCWSLLGNCGHTKYTYGVELTLLQHLQDSRAFRQLVLHEIRHTKLRKWARNVIANYRGEQTHYLIALLRLRNLTASSRTHGRLVHLLANLLVPLDELTFYSFDDRYKIYRLRELFRQVRLLCIVTLDAYYSHHPVRYQLSGALLNLANLVHQPARPSPFIELLERTAGWLADELYLHPNALAAQRAYELQALNKIRRQHKSKFSSDIEFFRFLPNIVESGFGKPKSETLSSLFRLTFTNSDLQSWRALDSNSIRIAIESETCMPPRTTMSVTRNPYTSRTHMDFFYHQMEATNLDIQRLLFNVYRWIDRLIERSVKRRIGYVTSSVGTGISDVDLDRIREDLFQRSAKRHQDSIASIFLGILDFLIPRGHVASIADHLPIARDDGPIRWSLRSTSGRHFDNVNERIGPEQLAGNSLLSPKKRHELAVLHSFFEKLSEPLIAVCTESIQIRDSKGRCVDQWDGAALAISNDDTSFYILEAKKRASGSQSENEAFSQLRDTRDLLQRHRRFTTRRTRIRKMGAYLALHFR